jgi:hypothetical protein
VRRCRGSNPGHPRDRREYSPLYYNDLGACCLPLFFKFKTLLNKDVQPKTEARSSPAPRLGPPSNPFRTRQPSSSFSHRPLQPLPPPAPQHPFQTGTFEYHRLRRGSAARSAAAPWAAARRPSRPSATTPSTSAASPEAYARSAARGGATRGPGSRRRRSTRFNDDKPVALLL